VSGSFLVEAIELNRTNQEYWQATIPLEVSKEDDRLHVLSQVDTAFQNTSLRTGSFFHCIHWNCCTNLSDSCHSHVGSLEASLICLSTMSTGRFTFPAAVIPPRNFHLPA